MQVSTPVADVAGTATMIEVPMTSFVDYNTNQMLSVQALMTLSG
jgi:hypothetical protein